MPSGQLSQEGLGRLAFVVLLALVSSLGVEAKEKDTDVLIQLVPVPAIQRPYSQGTNREGELRNISLLNIFAERKGKDNLVLHVL